MKDLGILEWILLVLISAACWFVIYLGWLLLHQPA